MDAEGQTAENPEPYIVNGSAPHAGGLEDAEEQKRGCHRQNAFSEKFPYCITSCHGQQPPSQRLLYR